jgi:RimJ/RimL family protein N-acetyltransferase
MLQPGEKLPDHVINLRLPMRMEPVTLIGKLVKIVPFDISHDSKQLFSMINGDPIEFRGRSFPSYDPNKLIWKNFIFGPFPTLESFENFLNKIISNQSNLIFCIKDVKTNTALGMVGYGDNSPENLKLKIRFGIASPVVWGTAFTLEATYLLFKHAFELGYRRVEGLIMAFNYRSTIHNLRQGYTFEGTSQYVHISKGISFDGHWVAVLDIEWKNRVKALLEKRIRNAIDLNPNI